MSDVLVNVGKVVWDKVKHKPLVYSLARKYNEYQLQRKYESIKPKLETIRKYYETCDFPELVDHSQWRQYRFLLWDGTGKKVKDQIRNKEALRKWLVRYAPKAVYCTTSTWMNPAKIGKREEYSKSQYRIGDNLMIGHDLIFDIDNKDLETSRKITLQLIDFMEPLGYKVKEIIFSGGKGFHVWFDDPEKISIADPREREYFYMAHRKEILAKVVNAGIKVDPVVTANTRCIVRVPGTVHWKTGFVACYCKREEIEKPIGEFLKTVKRVWPEGTFKKEKGDGEKIWGQITDNPEYFKMWQGNDSYHLSNFVRGTKNRYVLFLRFQYIWLDGVVERLQKLQERFNLTDVYLYGSDLKHRYTAVCLKTMQPEQIVKIVKACDAVNKEMLHAHGFRPSYIPVSEKFVDGEVLAPALSYITTLKGFPGENERHYVSKSHLQMMKEMGAPIANFPLQHGDDSCDLFLFKIEEGKLKEKIPVTYEQFVNKEHLKNTSSISVQNPL